MPVLNRDKERLYPPGKLSTWFLLTSVVMLASIVWMVAADHFARPWKGVQSDFHKRHAAVLRVRKEQAEADLRGNDERLASLRELNQRYAAAQQALAAPDRAKEIERLRDELAEQRTREAEYD